MYISAPRGVPHGCAPPSPQFPVPNSENPAILSPSIVTGRTPESAVDTRQPFGD
jgi:hypothetical protein